MTTSRVEEMGVGIILVWMKSLKIKQIYMIYREKLFEIKLKRMSSNVRVEISL